MKFQWTKEKPKVEGYYLYRRDMSPGTYPHHICISMGYYNGIPQELTVSELYNGAYQGIESLDLYNGYFSEILQPLEKERKHG